jgi:hypothetical protein
MSIQLHQTNSNKNIAYIRDKTNGKIVERLYATNQKEGNEDQSVRYPEFNVIGNIFTLPDRDKYALELSPEVEGNNQTNRIVLIGQSGSGKTVFLSQFLDRFRDKFIHHGIFLFSRHRVDPSIDWIKDLTRVDVSEADVIEAKRSGVPLFEIENLKNSVCVFDDCFSGSTILNKWYVQLLNDLEMNSRKYGINIIITLHNSDYSKTRFILSESNTFVFFLNSSAAMNKRIMKTYLGYDDKKAEKILNIQNSRYIILRNNAPFFIMTENQVFTERDIDNI